MLPWIPGRPNRQRLVGILGIALLSLSGCDDGVPSSRDGTTIPRETFVEAMVDLREAAIRSGGEAPSAAERERILQEHGIGAEDLRTFVEIHGENVPLMNEVWSAVERRLVERQEEEGLPDPSGDTPEDPGVAAPGSEEVE